MTTLDHEQLSTVCGGFWGALIAQALPLITSALTSKSESKPDKARDAMAIAQQRQLAPMAPRECEDDPIATVETGTLPSGGLA